MSALRALFPEAFPIQRLVVGVEPDPAVDGGRVVYLNHRSTGLHTHVHDPTAVAEVDRAWGSSLHLFTDVPADALCDCDPEETP